MAFTVKHFDAQNNLETKWIGIVISYIYNATCWLEYDRMTFIDDAKYTLCMNTHTTQAYSEQVVYSEHGVRTTSFRKRHLPYQACFKVYDNNTFVYCTNVRKLMKTMGIKYNTMDWNLFIDASSASLKAVLLHRIVEKPSILIAWWKSYNCNRISITIQWK